MVRRMRKIYVDESLLFRCAEDRTQTFSVLIIDAGFVDTNSGDVVWVGTHAVCFNADS
jgi:hypothetical protein